MHLHLRLPSNHCILETNSPLDTLKHSWLSAFVGQGCSNPVRASLPLSGWCRGFSKYQGHISCCTFYKQVLSPACSPVLLASSSPCRECSSHKFPKCLAQGRGMSVMKAGLASGSGSSPAQHSFCFSPAQGCRWSHATASLTLGYSVCNTQAPTCLHPPLPNSATAFHPCWVLSCGVTWAAGLSELGSNWDPKGPSLMLQLSETRPQSHSAATLCSWALQHEETVVSPFFLPFLFLLFCNWLLSGPRK